MKKKIKKSEKALSVIYSKGGFEVYLEKAKKKGLELILAIQNFTITPKKESLDTIHERVVDYWIVCKVILQNASKSELKHLVKVNKSFENTMNDLEIKEIYSNILKRHESKIQNKLEKKLNKLSTNSIQLV